MDDAPPLPDAPIGACDPCELAAPAAPEPPPGACLGEAPPADLPTALEPAPELDAWLFPAGRDATKADRRARAGVRTDGVLVLRGGVVVHEAYGPGWGPERPHLAWSASKSFTNALAGVAVREGLLDLDASICAYRPAATEAACAVTPRHLLEFSSGFDWHETYEGASPTSSSVLAMLYGQGQRDMYAFVTSHRLRDAPGTSWQYSSGDTNVLSGVVGAALGPRWGEDWPFDALFRPIGMAHTTFERDGAGTYVGSSYVWAPPRDLARFGLLLAADGCWGSERILPEGWVAASTTPAPSQSVKVVDRDPGDVQGRQLWLNRRVPGLQDEPPWPGVPEDAFAARGHWKQAITVIPSLDLVVVRVADDRDDAFDHAAFLRGVIDAFARPAPPDNAPPDPAPPDNAPPDNAPGAP